MAEEPSTKRYKLVIFDLDGVLVRVKSSWEYVHDYFNVPRDKRVRNYLDYVMGKIDYNEWINRDIELWNKALGRRLRRSDLLEAIEDIPVDPSVEFVVEELKNREYIVGIISAGIGQVAEIVSRTYGLDFWVANTITFDEDGVVSRNQRARMPPYQKPLMLLWIARRYGINVGETVYVGDSDWDIGVIRLAGCGIAYNCSSRLARNADVVIDRLKDVFDAIDQC